LQEKKSFVTCILIYLLVSALLALTGNSNACALLWEWALCNPIKRKMKKATVRSEMGEINNKN